MRHIFYLTILLVLSACDTKTNTQYYNLACDEEEKGNLAQAIKFLDKALEKKPSDIEALNNRGFDYLLLKQYDKAKANFGRMIELDRNCPGAYYALGYLNYELENYKAALGCFEKAIQIKGGGPLFVEYVPNSFTDPPFSKDAPAKLLVQYKELAMEKIKSKNKQ
ncbi:MAG TPA: tetratricopeptide repeat protein [Bacteroidia bacterium]|nr:tetratricopeptide repeat protein [Bacteroidia bacterium]